MPTLTTLPLEVIGIIVDQLTSISDLKHLSEVCRHLHHATIPHLYKSVIFCAEELLIPELCTLMETVPWERLKYTRELGFRAPIHDRRERRCIHNDELVDVDDSDTDSSSTRDPFFKLVLNLSYFPIPKNQLRSFLWELGTCLPIDLLEDTDLRDQKMIETISLITDGQCGDTVTTQYFIDLACFENLHSLKWKGLQRYDDFEAISKWIRTRGERIRSLDLDLVLWHNAELSWRITSRQSNRRNMHKEMPKNFFASTVLGIQPGVSTKSMTSLRNLSLSSVSFHYEASEMARAFNVEQLQNLKLRDCPGSLTWLDLIASSGKVMHLRCFEFQYNAGCTDLVEERSENITSTIAGFIQHLRGLEDLFLMLPQGVDWIEVSCAISGHSSSLHRVVCHHISDTGGNWLNDDEIPFNPQWKSILQSPSLYCFGTSMLPQVLLRECRSMPFRLPTCKLLHLRTSGVVLDGQVTYEQPTSNDPVFGTPVLGRRPLQSSRYEHEFADWAFGVDGFQNLQVLAFGDFSYDGRYSKYNVLLCRSEHGYQKLTRDQVPYWDLIQSHMDMLEACPYDNIFD